MSIVHDKLNEAEQENGLEYLAGIIGVSYNFLRDFKNGKNDKYRKKLIDKLYDYFKLEPDEYYYDNLRQWNQPTESVLGNIFRLRRVQMGRSTEEVARMIQGDARQIRRIESGDSLPSFYGYYITQFIKLYNFTEREVNTIKRYICILKDTIKILNKYDNFGDCSII